MRTDIFYRLVMAAGTVPTAMSLAVVALSVGMLLGVVLMSIAIVMAVVGDTVVLMFTRDSATLHRAYLVVGAAVGGCAERGALFGLRRRSCGGL